MLDEGRIVAEMAVGYIKHARVIESCSLKEKKTQEVQRNAIHVIAVSDFV